MFMSTERDVFHFHQTQRELVPKEISTETGTSSVLFQR